MTTIESKTTTALVALMSGYTTRSEAARTALADRADALSTKLHAIVTGVATGVVPTDDDAQVLVGLLGPALTEYRRTLDASRALAALATSERDATRQPDASRKSDSPSPTPKTNAPRTRTEVALSTAKPPVLIPESEAGVLDLTVHPLLKWNFHATRKAVLVAIEKSISHPKKLQTAKEGLAAAKGRPELIEVARRAGLRVVESAGPTG